MSAIEVDSVVTRFGTRMVHDGISFSVPRGQIVALIGGSGSGKSVLLREIIGLLRPAAGSVRVLGTDVWNVPEEELAALRRRFGMMFQDGALFSSLTVADNVATPLREHARVPAHLLAPLVQLRIALAGLPAEAGERMPSELSGGMRKRFDKLVRVLADQLGLTIFLVTHDLDTLLGIVDRAIVLAQGKLIADGTVSEVMHTDHPWLRSYFDKHGT
jgi:phospholipid/cholesterol/gamma-HCH transport system ATP-binding protein